MYEYAHSEFGVSVYGHFWRGDCYWDLSAGCKCTISLFWGECGCWGVEWSEGELTEFVMCRPVRLLSDGRVREYDMNDDRATFGRRWCRRLVEGYDIEGTSIPDKWCWQDGYLCICEARRRRGRHISQRAQSIVR